MNLHPIFHLIEGMSRFKGTFSNKVMLLPFTLVGETKDSMGCASAHLPSLLSPAELHRFYIVHRCAVQHIAGVRFTSMNMV